MPGTAKLHSWIAKQWRHRSLWSKLTSPLACLYGLIAEQRRQSYRSGHRQAFKAPVPVIVIGNIYVGGTGKTPLAVAIGQLLQSRGWRPALVSRGVGRLASRSAATGQGCDLDWQLFGDEPALIARKSGMPVGVHESRRIAVEQVLSHYPNTDIIICDDGLQHYGLARDFEILVQDERGIGNGLLLPAGPLREPPSRLAEVDLVLRRSSQTPAVQACTNGELAFRLEIDGFWQPATGEELTVEQFVFLCQSQRPVVAMAGIGVPQRFFDSLENLGINLDQKYPLADHAPIRARWLSKLPKGTILVTEKDAIKLAAPVADPRIWVAKTTVRWWRNDSDEFIMQKLASAGIKRTEQKDGPQTAGYSGLPNLQGSTADERK